MSFGIKYIIGDDMKEGFTLIELMSIMALLGIIIVIAVPSMIQSNKDALKKEKEEFKTIIQTACESYVQVKLGKEADWRPKNGVIKAKTLISEGYLNGSTKNPNSQTNPKQTIAEEGKTISVHVGEEITCTYND